MASSSARGGYVVEMPPELETGVYASALTVWHTPHEFTLDFGTFVPATPPLPSEPEPRDVEVRGVSRVKVPPAVVFDMIRTIHANMTRYEESHGAIHYPEDE